MTRSPTFFMRRIDLMIYSTILITGTIRIFEDLFIINTHIQSNNLRILFNIY